MKKNEVVVPKLRSGNALCQHGIITACLREQSLGHCGQRPRSVTEDEMVPDGASEGLSGPVSTLSALFLRRAPES